MFEQIKAWVTASPIAILDLVIVFFIFYRLYLIIRGTRAVQLLKGLAILIVASLVSQYAGLNITGWFLNQILTVGFIAVPIIFYPELRRALEHLGRGSIFPKSSILAPGERTEAIDELVQAVTHLAARRIGALVVWEQEIGLKDWSETGVDIDAALSAELLINIFEPNTPLHDGAVILRGNRIRAASCYLPLSDNPELKVGLGTRHRAALGITEHSDAAAIIVSEETGAVSLAAEGKLMRYLDDKSLRDWLEKNLHKRQQDHFFRRMQTGWKE
jgi:diadenylate cyclase